MRYKWMIALSVGAAVLAYTSSCVSIPKGASAVRSFELSKYLGTWYEIARKDFRFEKNLNNVTANYSMKDNGMVKVVNRGYDYKENKWKESVGKAKPVGAVDQGRLKVSFFGPFYAGYNIIAIDPEYQYALVAGNDLKNLWILSREITIPKEVKQRYLQKARDIGYETNDLVWPDHGEVKP